MSRARVEAGARISWDSLLYGLVIVGILAVAAVNESHHYAASSAFVRSAVTSLEAESRTATSAAAEWDRLAEVVAVDVRTRWLQENERSRVATARVVLLGSAVLATVLLYVFRQWTESKGWE